MQTLLVLAAALPRPGSGGTQLPMAGTDPPDALPAQQCISIIFCVSHLCKRARDPLNLLQRYSPCRHVEGTAQPLRQQPAGIAVEIRALQLSIYLKLFFPYSLLPLLLTYLLIFFLTIASITHSIFHSSFPLGLTTYILF